MTRYITSFIRYLRNTKAISALEYAILLGIISLALVGALGVFVGTDSTGIRGAIKQIGDNIKTETANTGKTAPTTPTN